MLTKKKNSLKIYCVWTIDNEISSEMWWRNAEIGRIFPVSIFAYVQFVREFWIGSPGIFHRQQKSCEMIKLCPMCVWVWQCVCIFFSFQMKYYHLFECFSNLTANLENNTVAPKTRYSSVYRADVLYYSGTVRRRNELLSERSLTKIIYIHKRNIHAGRPPDYYSGK